MTAEPLMSRRRRTASGFGANAGTLGGAGGGAKAESVRSRLGAWAWGESGSLGKFVVMVACPEAVGVERGIGGTDFVAGVGNLHFAGHSLSLIVSPDCSRNSRRSWQSTSQFCCPASCPDKVLVTRTASGEIDAKALAVNFGFWLRLSFPAIRCASRRTP